MVEIRIADYERGTPQDDEAKARNAQIRAYVRAWDEEMNGEFPDGLEMWDLVCGEIEAVDLATGTSYRLYVLQFYDEDEPRLIIDDYIPSDEAVVEVDDDGVPFPGDELDRLEADWLAAEDDLLQP